MTHDPARIAEVAKGETYRSEGIQMFSWCAPDQRGDPTVEVWAFRGEDDPDHGEGHLEIYVHEIVPTQNSGTLAVYYRQWFNPEGERLWSRKRAVGNLASLKALIRRRKMHLLERNTDG